MPPRQPDAGSRPFDWALLLILLGAGLIGVLATIPLILEWLPRLLGPEEQEKLRLLPLPLVFALGLVQNGALLGIAIGVGLVLARRLGLGAPELQAWRAGEARPGLFRRLAFAGAMGLITGLVLIALDSLLLLPRTGTDLARWMSAVPLWKRLLAGLVYGGITEELLFRLFLLTLLIWLFGKLWRTADLRPAPGAVWLAIILTAVFFAAGHLPTAGRLTDLSPWLVVRAMVLNVIPGVAYGWLYISRGLESAMVAHAATHIPLQLLAGVAVRIADSISPP